MTIRTVLPLALAALALASPPVRAASPASCPDTPTRVERSAGGVVDYNGTFAGIPDLCHVSRADGQGYFYYGVWRSDWPGAGDAYPALHAVILGPPGSTARFTTRSVPGLQWVDTLTNEGTSVLVVGGVPHTVLQLAHERSGIEGNTYHSIITSWRDVETGVNLKTVENQIAGQSYGPDTTWLAVRVGALP